MYERPVLLLVNALSGKGRAQKIAGFLRTALEQKKIGYDFFTEAGWPESLAGYSEVWLAGGDGTVNYFINRYPAAPIPLAIFKGGTGNDLAWKLYGDSSLEEQLSIVLKALPKKIDLGSCNGRLYANSLGIGFDGEVLRSMRMIRWLGGHLGYLFVVIKKTFSFREFHFSIKAGNRKLNEKYLLVIINNSSRTGGGFLVSPNASLTDGMLDLVLCKKLPLLKRLRYLPVIEKGKHLDLPFIHYSHEKNITIECETEIFAQVDGELISGKCFEVKIVKDALWIKY